MNDSQASRQGWKQTAKEGTSCAPMGDGTWHGPSVRATITLHKQIGRCVTDHEYPLDQPKVVYAACSILILEGDRGEPAMSKISLIYKLCFWEVCMHVCVCVWMCVLPCASNRPYLHWVLPAAAAIAKISWTLHWHMRSYWPFWLSPGLSAFHSSFLRPICHSHMGRHLPVLQIWLDWDKPMTTCHHMSAKL